jgi:uncharacterized protein (DUF433 family)
MTKQGGQASERLDAVQVIPGRLSGAPVLRSTRVSAILNNYDGGLDPEETAETFEVSVVDVRTRLEFREEQIGRRA